MQLQIRLQRVEIMFENALEEYEAISIWGKRERKGREEERLREMVYNQN
jgi:hypothetical protein